MVASIHTRMKISVSSGLTTSSYSDGAVIITDYEGYQHTEGIIPSYHNSKTGNSVWKVHGVPHRESGKYNTGYGWNERYTLNGEYCKGRLLLW